MGVYEPALVVGRDGMQRTSLAREPELSQDQVVVHAHCLQVEGPPAVA